jgi:hypothetical protein
MRVFPCCIQKYEKKILSEEKKNVAQIERGLTSEEELQTECMLTRIILVFITSGRRTW